MSDWLHRTRLRWCAATGSGVAVHEGVTVELRSRPPVLLAMGRLIELEYSPGIGVLYAQLATGARQDLLPVQQAECLRYLRAVALAGRTAVDTRVV